MVADYSVWNLDKTLRWDSPELNCIAFSPDGQTIAVGGGAIFLNDNGAPHLENGRVQLWDVSDGAPKLSLADPADEVHSVAFYPDGLSLAVGDTNKVKIVDVKTGSIRFILPEGSYGAIAINGQEKILATNGGRSFWDPITGQKKPSFIVSDHFAVFSPDGKIFYVDGSLWDVRTGTKYARLSDEAYTHVAFSHDGQFVASAYGLWTIRGGKPLWSIAVKHINRRGRNRSRVTSGVLSPGAASGAAFSPDDRFLITFDYNGEFKVHDSSTGMVVMEAKPHLDVYEMALSPDGTVLLTADRSATDDPLKIWRIGLRRAPPAP